MTQFRFCAGLAGAFFLLSLLAGPVQAAVAPPIATPESYTLAGLPSLHISAPGVLANDTNSGGGPLSAVLVSGPANAQVFELRSDGSFVYTAMPGYVGTDSFSYRASNGLESSGTATVQLTVAPSNDPRLASTFEFAVIGDFGDDGPNAAAVASLIQSWSPDVVLTVGDNNYETGQAETIDANVGSIYNSFIFPYLGAYGPGSDFNRFFPTIGNHDFETDQAQPHLDYFTLPGNERYFKFTWGPVEFFALASDIREPDGATETSVQAAWLQSALAASTAPWKVVYFHHTPYVSRLSGGAPHMRWPFAAWGADLVLAGHTHVYERLELDGIPLLVNGLGGHQIFDFTANEPRSRFQYNDDYGAQRITADDCLLTIGFHAVGNPGVAIDPLTLDRCTIAAPTGVDDNYQLVRGESVVLPAPGVMANDLHESGAIVELLTSPTNASAFSLSLNGALTYVPEAGFSGIDRFTYRVSENGLYSEETTVTFTVLAGANDICYLVADNDNFKSGSADMLTSVRLADGVESVIGQTGTAKIEAMAVDPITGTIYAADAGTIGTINPLTGTFSYIGVPGTAYGSAGPRAINDLDGLAFDPYSGYLIGTERRGGGDLLVKMHPSTGELLRDAFGPGLDYIVLAVPGYIDDIAVSPVTGEAFVIYDDGETSSLYTIDLETGVASPGPQLIIHDIEGLGYAPNGLLVGSEGGYGRRLWVIDPVTGSVTQPLGLGRGGNGDYEGVDCVGELIDPPGNTLPIAVGDTASTDEDTPVQVYVLNNDTDPDGDLLTVTDAGNGSNGTVAIQPDGSIIYTPTADFNGMDLFGYTISDGRGGVMNTTVEVTVTAIPDAPVAADDAAATEEDSPVTIDVIANDTDGDGDVLFVSIITNGSNGTVEILPDGMLRYTPATDFRGMDAFVYTVSDGVLTDDATVAIAVAATNDAPVADDDEATGDEDTVISIDVLIGDTDIDGDTLSVSQTTTPTNGTVAIAPDGTLNYTPALDFHGSDSFEYTVTDGFGGVDTGLVSITVLPVNDNPVAVSDTTSTGPGQPVIVSVLLNDLDVDGDPIVLTGIASAPEFGNAVDNQDGTLTYTPGVTFSGQDTFTYAISDGIGGVATGTVLISALSAVADQIETDEETPVVFDPTTNDSDPENDPISLTALGTPLHGVVSQDANQITYTPTSDFAGADSLTYSITDGQGHDAQGTIVITVRPVNDAPIADDDSAAGDEDTVISIDVLTGDIDVDGDTLFVSLTTSPANGTVVIAPDGSLSYTPALHFHGTDSFEYTVSDGNGGTDTGSVSITVNPVNDNPVAVEDVSTTYSENPVIITPAANDTDVDGDPVTFATLSTYPANGTVVDNLDGTLTYTSDPLFAGSDAFTYAVTDGNGGTAVGTVTVTVLAPEPPADICYLVADNGSGPDVLTRLENGVESIIGGTGTVDIEAIARHPETGVLYAADAGIFGTLNPATGVFTQLGIPGIALGAQGERVLSDIDGLAFDAVTGILYATARAPNQNVLVRLIPNTGEIDRGAFGAGQDYALIGINGNVEDLAIDPATGIAWTIHDNGSVSVLYSLDLNTGATVQGATLPRGDIEGLAFAIDGTMVGSEGSSGKALWNINYSTGALTRRATLGRGSNNDYESVDCEVLAGDPPPPVIDLTLSATADVAAPVIGTELTITLELTNERGNAQATGIVVPFTIPTGLVLTGSNPPVSGNVWSAGTLDYGATATLQLTLRADGLGAHDVCAFVAAALPDDLDSEPGTPSSEDDEDCVTISVQDVPPPVIDLMLASVATVVNPVINTDLTATLTLTNEGGNTAATGIEVTFAIPSGLALLSSTPDGGSSVLGSVWTIAPLALNESATLQLSLRAETLGAASLCSFVSAAAPSDLDSVPGAALGEDDESCITITVVDVPPPPPPPSDVCYLVADNDGSGANTATSRDQLVAVFKNDNTEVVIGATGTTAIEAIAFSPFDGALFAIDRQSLGTLDLETGAFAAIGSAGSGNGPLGILSFGDIDGLTFDPNTGALYGSVRRSGADVIVMLDPSTGLAIPGVFGGNDYLVIGGGSGIDVDDLAIDPVDGSLIAMLDRGGDPTQLVTINRTDGSTTLLTTLDTNKVEGLTFDGDGTLIASIGSSAKKIVTIDRATGVTTLRTTLGANGNQDYESIDCLTNTPNEVTLRVVDTSGTVAAHFAVQIYRDLEQDGIVNGDDVLLHSHLTSEDGLLLVRAASTGGFVLRIGNRDHATGFDGFGQSRNLGDVMVGETTSTANESAADMPDAFRLVSTYPNPFNPQATIAIDLPETARVRLAVYDVLGREVAVLINGVTPAGSQSVVFNADQLPSGMYLVRFASPSGVFTRAMTLLR